MTDDLIRHSGSWRRLLTLALLLGVGGCHRAPPDLAPRTDPAAEWERYQPRVVPASVEPERLLRGIRVPEGFRVALFAAEPLLANPVAFVPDGLGRFLVCETFRQEDFGVPDNRAFPHWLDDDLSAQTVEDRQHYYLAHHPEVVETWTKEEDRIRLVVDATGDGRADRSQVFAGGFRSLLDGTGAGVLRVGDHVLYTCIPHLWQLTDQDRDDRAEVRSSLAYGFGVRTALRGHDLHGLIQGPDGRIYFSVGDRGYHVRTMEGAVLADPGRGAVFRCEPDGQGLEVFATGLRNPQELAFDDFGNLITGDNNSDSDDQARLVYVVEGAEIGWRMNFQTLATRGPWVDEGWWKPRHEGQAAFLLPPIANLGNGPSGLVAAPGTGLPAAYAGAFFLCDFVGTRTASTGGVWAFWLEPDGAGLRLARSEMFAKGLLPTDVDFAPDGGLYVSDFGHGWVGEGKGRLYRISHSESEKDPAARDVARWSSLAVTEAASATLLPMLAHPDRRLRLRAQFALVERPTARRLLTGVARGNAPVLARIHALFGLSQLSRRDPTVLSSVVSLLEDGDPRIRAQAASLLADVAYPEARAALERSLTDVSLRVRRFALMALGRIGDPRSLPPIVAALVENGDRDVYVRLAGVLALERLAAREAGGVLALGAHPDTSVRLAVLLALRRRGDRAIVRFLSDPVPALRTEAARAIYDQPIPDAWPALAAAEVGGMEADRPFLRRVVAANDLLSTPAAAAALARGVSAESWPMDVRRLALQALSRWGDPPRRDLVLNEDRPRHGRQLTDALGPAAAVLPGLLEQPQPLRAEAIAAVGRLGLAGQEGSLRSLLEDSGAEAGERVAALEILARRAVEDLDRLAAVALRSGVPRLRAKGCEALARVDLERAVEVAAGILDAGEVPEQQQVLAFLAGARSASARRLLGKWMDRLTSQNLDARLHLDVLEAVRAQVRLGAPELEEPLQQREAWRAAAPLLERWGHCLLGGDAERGRRVFHADSVNCRRCHSLEDGGPLLAGPPLARVGAERDRRQILESILDPNATVLPGYENERIELASGRWYDGRVLEERDGHLLIEFDETGTPERERIPVAEVTSRVKGRSGMPTDVAEKLSAEELRDLVEFLSRQGSPRESAPR